MRVVHVLLGIEVATAHGFLGNTQANGPYGGLVTTILPIGVACDDDVPRVRVGQLPKKTPSKVEENSGFVQVIQSRHVLYAVWRQSQVLQREALLFSDASTADTSSEFLA